VNASGTASPKPLVYVDQSILGRHLAGSITLRPNSSLQWVYSTEHFAEMRRSTDPDKYLAVLDAAGAQLLDAELVQWKLTGAAQLVAHGTAREHYTRYCHNVDEVPAMDSIFDPMLAWLNGGGDAALLKSLPQHLVDKLRELLGDGVAFESATATLQAGEDEFRVTLNQLISDGNDINRLRAAMGLGKGAAGSVSGQGQLEQIWRMISPQFPGVTSDRFFGFEGQPTYVGIIGCCSMLDILGFQGESKVRNIRSVPNVRSDAKHIAMGAFCQMLLSADKRLIKRAAAIYEYKNIGTLCGMVASAH
jgi:hypothetical protein